MAEGLFVLKHISSLKGQAAKLSGLREAYFGVLLHRANHTAIGMQQSIAREGFDHIVRFVESFQVRPHTPVSLLCSKAPHQ